MMYIIVTLAAKMQLRIELRIKNQKNVVKSCRVVKKPVGGSAVSEWWLRYEVTEAVAWVMAWAVAWAEDWAVAWVGLRRGVASELSEAVRGVCA